MDSLEVDESTHSSDEDEPSDKSNLSKVSLCRVNLNKFNTTGQKKKDYFDVRPQDHAEIDDEAEVDLNQADAQIRQVINNIMNHLHERQGQNSNSNDFAKEESTNNDQLIVFSRPHETKDQLLSNCGVVHKKCRSYSSLVFLPIVIENELSALYVVSGGHAWQTMYHFTDYDFLGVIPLKIGDPEGALCHKVDCLVGKYYSKDSVMNKPVNLKDLDLGEVCTKFTGQVNKNIIQGKPKSMQASLLPNIKETETSKFTVTAGRIVFNTHVTMKDIKHLVENLEIIYKDDNEEYLIPTQTKLHRLVMRVNTEAEKALNKELEQHLIFRIQQCELNGDAEEELSLKNFNLCHKFEREYVEAPRLDLHFMDKVVYLESNPTTESVFQNVAELVKAKTFYGNKLDLKKHFPTIKITFKGKVQKPREDSLLGYLRGNFYSTQEKCHYWVLNNKWYCVEDDMIMEIQRKFQQILGDHLMPPKYKMKPPLLWKPWKFKSRDKLIDESDFNKEYAEEQGYFMGDKITPRTIEYFDIAFNNKEQHTTYLYHVKEGFNNVTRDACSQLYNSVEMLEGLRNPHKSSSTDPADINELTEKVFGGNQSTCNTVLGINLNSSGKQSTLVYVLALQTNLNLVEVKSHKKIHKKMFADLRQRYKHRSLWAEKDLEHTVSPEYLKEYITNNKELRNTLENAFGEDDLANKLTKQLIEYKYFNEHGRQLYVTAKLLLMEDKPFSEFQEVLPIGHSLNSGEVRELCRQLKIMLEKYSTYFQSLGAKLEIVRCRNCVESKVPSIVDNFKICEILVSKDRPEMKAKDPCSKDVRTPQNRIWKPKTKKVNKQEKQTKREYRQKSEPSYKIRQCHQTHLSQIFYPALHLQ